MALNLRRMKWINFNIHKDIFQAVISSSKKAFTATNIWKVETNLRRQNCRLRQNCRRENNCIVT